MKHSTTSETAHVAPWFAFNAAWWPQIAQALVDAGAPWPEEAAAADLRWHADQTRMGRLPRVPSYRRLAARWAWTEHRARVLMRSEGLWACPVHVESRTLRARLTHSSRTSEPIAELEPTSDAQISRTPRAEIATRARSTEEHKNTETEIIHTSEVATDAPATPSSEAPPAPPECVHGTPLKSILSSDLTGILEAAGLTAIEDLRGHSRDSVAYLCAPRMSRGRLTALDQALRRWSRARGEEWGLSAEGGGTAPVQESAELLQERARQQAAAEQPRQARASWTPPEPVWLRDHARWRQEAYGTRPATPQPIGPTPFDLPAPARRGA